MARKTAWDKFLREKAFAINKNPKYDGYQTGFACMIYNFFDKKFSAGGIKSRPNQQLAAS